MEFLSKSTNFTVDALEIAGHTYVAGQVRGDKELTIADIAAEHPGKELCGRITDLAAELNGAGIQDPDNA